LNSSYGKLTLEAFPLVSEVPWVTEPELIHSMSRVVDDVDFAVLSVGPLRTERPDSLILATSSREGILGLVTGSKFSRVSIALERWTSQPPTGSKDWEDQDEVPFEVKSDRLYPAGFEAPNEGDAYLDVAGLGRSRVRVRATGRRFAEGLTDTDDQTDEDWLVQLWPDHQSLDAMAGGPRILEASPLQVPDIDQFVGNDNPASKRDLLHAYPVMWDLFHLLHWEPDLRLSRSVEDLASRLAVSSEHIVGGAYALVQWGYGRSDCDIPSLRASDTLNLKSRHSKKFPENS